MNYGADIMIVSVKIVFTKYAIWPVGRVVNGFSDTVLQIYQTCPISLMRGRFFPPNYFTITSAFVYVIKNISIYLKILNQIFVLQ